MSALTTATLSVPFSERSSGRIVLVQATDRFDFYGRLHVYCYSSIPAEYMASVGMVTAGENRSLYILGEGVKFSDSSTATLKYPNATNVVINLASSVFMRRVTRFGTTTFERFYPTITYDSDNDILISEFNGNPQAVYGACSVSYTVPYQVVYYVPQFTSTTTGAAGVYGGVFGLGTLFAYNEQAVETLDIELDLTSPKDWMEFCRVTSKIVLDQKGVWEFPPNWESTYRNNEDRIGDERSDYTENGFFPSLPYEVDALNCFVDTRVHLIIEVSSVGTLRYTDFNNGGNGYIAWEDPYFGVSNYSPQYIIDFNTPPGGGAQASSAQDFRDGQNTRIWNWRKIFLDVDKADVLENILAVYNPAYVASDGN